MPSLNFTEIWPPPAASATTWLLVMIIPSERMITPVPSAWPLLGRHGDRHGARLDGLGDRRDSGGGLAGRRSYGGGARVRGRSLPITAATAPPARPPPRIRASARPPAATFRRGVHQACRRAAARRIQGRRTPAAPRNGGPRTPAGRRPAGRLPRNCPGCPDGTGCRTPAPAPTAADRTALAGPAPCLPAGASVGVRGRARRRWPCLHVLRTGGVAMPRRRRGSGSDSADVPLCGSSGLAHGLVMASPSLTPKIRHLVILRESPMGLEPP